SVPGMTPYQSRVGLEAQNSATSAANFDILGVDVVYSNTFTSGVIQFSSPTYTAQENQGSIQIDVVRIGGTVGSFAVSFVATDGTAKNGVNYNAVSGALTFPSISGPGSTGTNTQTIVIPIIDDHLYDGDKTVNLYLSNPTLVAPMGSVIQATLTIQNTDAPPPTVSPTVTKIYVPGTRRLSAFLLTFSQPMDLTSAGNVNNYVVSLPPARRGGRARTVPISRAAVDPSGLYVTLYRTNVVAHLTRFVQIIVRGKPSTGLLSQSGTFLAGSNGVSGTDAKLVVSGY
ncbi:MAG: Calx-beta domain-containing protein, partial [Isosphaeraceae bacterium]